MGTRNLRRAGTLAARLAVAALGVAMLSGTATADDSRKQDRQIDVFERIVDDMLVESPNWLVQGRHETRGRYRSGEGARFTFDASLVYRGWRSGWSGGGKWWRFWDHDDDDVIIIDRDDWEDLDDDELLSLRRDRRELREKHLDRVLRREERLYKRGKSEMVDVLADFGDLMTTLPDNESIELVAYLDDSEYFYEKDLRQLSLAAKMSDVRAYANGSIDDEEFMKRIVVDES